MKFKPSSSSSKKPFVLKHGNVTLKIYSGTNRVNGISYPQFTLVYHDGSQRRKKRFVDFEAAKKEAKILAQSLSNGENQMLQLTSADRSIYLQATKILQPLQVPLNVAVLEYVSALSDLPNGATLKEAVSFFRRRNPVSMEKRTIRQVADELLMAKRTANLSRVYRSVDTAARLDTIAKKS